LLIDSLLTHPLWKVRISHTSVNIKYIACVWSRGAVNCAVACDTRALKEPEGYRVDIWLNVYMQ